MSNDLIQIAGSQPAVLKMSENYGLDVEVFIKTVISISMPQGVKPSEVFACLMVAQTHGLNPLTREIFFMKTRSGGIQPVVSVDGWIRKCNEHQQFDGLEVDFDWSGEGDTRKLLGAWCSIWRRDRSRPVKVYEDLQECMSAGGPVWKTHPKRMLRNRVVCQAARLAFGFAGVMIEDEFADWQQGNPVSDAPLERPKRKSSAQAKRDGDADEMKAILAAIKTSHTRIEASDLYEQNRSFIEALPYTWQRIFDDEFSDFCDGLPMASEAAA